jgi:hypothetical protein
MLQQFEAMGVPKSLRDFRKALVDMLFWTHA